MSRITKQQAQDAVNLLFSYSLQIRDSVSIYRDDEAGNPMVIVTACQHCGKLFDEFAKLDDNGKAKALQSANAENPHASNDTSEERQQQKKETENIR